MREISQTPTLSSARIWTGRTLGGAVATHMRVGVSVGSILFPVLLGMLIWLGLYLRDHRARALLDHSY